MVHVDGALGAGVPRFMKPQLATVAIATVLVDREHLTPVGSRPPVLEAEVVDLRTVSPCVNEGVDSGKSKNLWQLRYVSERIGHISHFMHRPDPARNPVAKDEIANHGFCADQELIR